MFRKPCKITTKKSLLGRTAMYEFFMDLFERYPQSDVDREQNEKIEEISKETKKALALQDELDSLRERLGVPKEE